MSSRRETKKRLLRSLKIFEKECGENRASFKTTVSVNGRLAQMVGKKEYERERRRSRLKGMDRPTPLAIFWTRKRRRIDFLKHIRRSAKEQKRLGTTVPLG